VAALARAISTFEGAVVAVSHDEAFVNSLLGSTTPEGGKNTAIYTLAHQKIQRFEGNFRDYKKQIMKGLH